MAEDLYQRLYRELHASRFDSPEANAAIEKLGAPGRAVRALATVRHHNFGSTRADLLAALAEPQLAPIIELVLGVGLYTVREYDLALTTLARAAGRGKPGIAKQARMLALRFASALGWTHEARELAAALGTSLASSDSLDAQGQQASDAGKGGDDPQRLLDRARELTSTGEHLEAAELLERARACLPRSITITLALALARHREAPNSHGEGLEHRFGELLAWAPGLLSDAAAQLGVTLWSDQGVVIERATMVELLERAEQLLTREHELTHPSYRVRSHDGQLRLRHIPHVEPSGPTLLERLHADDRKLVDQLEGVLVHALGITPPRNAEQEQTAPAAPVVRRPSVWQPRLLTPEQIEQFLVDGFIVVPRAFDPELARAWREDANRRIREEPEKWVRGYDPNDESRSLRNYSPDDPSTWTWGRIDLLGPETVVIEEFAPAAWATICDLLGGPGRVKTKTWTNYLILNLCDEAHLDTDVPEPDWKSWHIDDPRPATRIDRIVNGLVGIALFDRVLPRSGNTWIVPDSIPLVARDLAAHPEGVDYVVNRGTQIAMQCKRFHEFVGEAGDVLLMHSLMLHSGAPNRSGRIRWMGNPMIYLHEPLDPFRPVHEMSPVELAIHRALQ